jgi:hypothetical protein
LIEFGGGPVLRENGHTGGEEGGGEEKFCFHRKIMIKLRNRIMSRKPQPKK